MTHFSKMWPEQVEPTALLLVDVINDFDFAEGNMLLRFAMPIAKRLKALKDRTRRAGLPVIYANDNFGLWQSSFEVIVDHCLRSKGREVVRILAPEPADYFVLKPKQSGFYSTSLEVLLNELGVKRLIIGGIAADICVLFTAMNAYMREYSLCVPSDCVASSTKLQKDSALRQMADALKADTRLSGLIDVELEEPVHAEEHEGEGVRRN